MNYKESYKFWCESDYFDEKTKKELHEICEDEAEIQERFYKELAFGTGGLRGVLGAGTNRMNIYTVRKATQGLANFILMEKGSDRGVAIAYDSRNMSPEFADEAALCLAANGIKAYVFESLRPTPELSFTVRELGCIGGIVITASHNPPEYNGYKVYWEDGAQITAPKDREIITEINKISHLGQVKTMKKESAVKEGLYITIGKELDDRYIEEVKKLSIHPEIIRKVADQIKIVYSPLHGTGNLPVRRILSELGFTNVYVVPEQELPDGNFSTVAYPNPEDPKAFSLALALARKVDADIVLTTDPDADRLGVYAKDRETGEYISFTGNMSGTVIAEYILSQRKEAGTLPLNGALVKTIVTTNMANVMAREYHVHLIEVLTGFKYIGEQIKLFEENGTYEYLFGMEESYGCLVGTHARDKDAVAAVMAICEVAAHCKNRGITLWDYMKVMYRKYGYFKEDMEALTLKGKDGTEKIQKVMENMRWNPPKELGGMKVLVVRDYETGIRKELSSGATSKIALPKSNVLYYELENDAWCCARPSGTEPKIKFYMGVKGHDIESAQHHSKNLKHALLAWIRE